MLSSYQAIASGSAKVLVWTHHK